MKYLPRNSHHLLSFSARWARGTPVSLFKALFGLSLSMGAVAIGVIIASALWRNTDRPLVTGEAFDTVRLLDAYFVQDLGVADINDDGILDIYTSNHSAGQHILLGEGEGAFQGVPLRELGLDHTPAFPGFAATTTLPPVDSPGLFISYYGTALVLRSKVDGAAGRGRGEVSFSWPARVVSDGGISFAVTSESRISFNSTDDGELWIEPEPPPSDGFPIRILLREGFPLDEVHVGPGGINPEQRTFILTPKDRHGMAWADYNGDGHTDLFIARGGVRGRAELVGVERDELFIRRGAIFEDVIVGSGIEKDGCPGRQVSWVDFDGDNRLDLYLVCGRGRPPGDQSRNRLYKQQRDGSFVEIASDVGLAILGEGAFSWFDVEPDGDPDLLWAGQGELSLYRNTNGYFSSERVAKARGRPRNLALGDFDADQDLDVYVISNLHSTVLVNQDGNLLSRHPADFGLPSRALTASWVDFDNDGALDLAAIPGGLYRQKEPDQFVVTKLLDARTPWFLSAFSTLVMDTSFFRDARASWFDANHDGALDAVVAVEPCWLSRICSREKHVLWAARRWLQTALDLLPPLVLFDSRRWMVGFIQGHGNENHWLAVEVVGPPGNRQSIGARVTIRTEQSARVAEVGQLDGSHFSQGNYGLHFGLDGESVVKILEVNWPDGKDCILENLAADRLIKVHHPAFQPITSSRQQLQSFNISRESAGTYCSDRTTLTTRIE